MTDALNQEMSRTERRRFILRGLMRGLILSLILILLYFLGPLDRIDAVPVWIILVIGPIVLLAVSVWQIRAILRSDQPGLRESRRSRSSLRCTSSCSPRRTS